jgi:hypothetical protein
MHIKVHLVEPLIENIHYQDVRNHEHQILISYTTKTNSG